MTVAIYMQRSICVYVLRSSTVTALLTWGNKYVMRTCIRSIKMIPRSDDLNGAVAATRATVSSP